VTYLFLALLAIALIVVAVSSRRRSVLSAAILAFARSMDTTPLHAKTRSSRGMRSADP
jgi:hypothetical protein